MIDFSAMQQPIPDNAQPANISNPAYAHQSYTTPGPVQQPAQEVAASPTPIKNITFNNLLKGNTIVGTSPDLPIVTGESPINKTTTKKKKSTSVSGEVVNSKDIVEHTVYSDTYADTNGLAYGIVAQTDELLNGAKQELDWIRAQRSLKGKYHYMTAMYASMSSLLGTKLQAIREINTSIKNINDMEYRRFKDNRAIEQGDDNKAIMDAYKAFISAPVGAPEYYHPSSFDITSGTSNVIKNEYPAHIQQQMDNGLANYLSNLTPQERVMLNEGNPNIEEVLVYDQATGAKYFQWMDTKTNTPIEGMAPSSTLTVEDFVIDPRTRTAKNTNLNQIKKVVYLNENIGINY